MSFIRKSFPIAGFEIETAEDASAAMMKFQTVKPDLLIDTARKLMNTPKAPNP